MQLARRIFFLLIFPSAAFAQSTFSCPGNQYVTTQTVNTGQGCSALPTAVTNAITGLTGDVTATGPGSAAASVVKVNGAAFPASTAVVGTNASGQVVAVPSQTAATVLAAPSGAAGVPSFRALVATDIPTIASTKVSGLATSATTDTTNATNIASGTLPAARLPLATTSAFGAVKPDGTTITVSGGVISSSGGGSMVYPGVGVTVSTGTAWDTPVSLVGTGTSGLITSTLTSPAGAALITYSGACNCYINAGITTPQLALQGGNANSYTVVQTFRHIAGSGTPAVAAGAGAGTGSAVALVGGTDLSGTVTVTTGTSPIASAAVATVTFASAYASAPKCVAWPSSIATQALAGVTQAQILRANTTTAVFVLTQGSTALAASTAYEWGYTCSQ